VSDTALKILEDLNERSERPTIEEVGRFIEADNVRTAPGSGTKDDLDLSRCK
jgi:hypothetical protein